MNSYHTFVYTKDSYSFDILLADVICFESQLIWTSRKNSVYRSIIRTPTQIWVIETYVNHMSGDVPTSFHFCDYIFSQFCISWLTYNEIILRLGIHEDYPSGPRFICTLLQVPVIVYVIVRSTQLNLIIIISSRSTLLSYLNHFYIYLHKSFRKT